MLYNNEMEPLKGRILVVFITFLSYRFTILLLGSLSIKPSMLIISWLSIRCLSVSHLKPNYPLIKWELFIGWSSSILYQCWGLAIFNFQFTWSSICCHIAAVRWYLQYPKGKINHEVLYQPRSLNLSSYANVEWSGDPCDQRFSFGLAYILSPIQPPSLWNKLYWHIHSLKAKYYSLAVIVVELSWFHMILRDLDIHLKEKPCSGVTMPGHLHLSLTI